MNISFGIVSAHVSIGPVAGEGTIFCGAFYSQLVLEPLAGIKTQTRGGVDSSHVLYSCTFLVRRPGLRL